MAHLERQRTATRLPVERNKRKKEFLKVDGPRRPTSSVTLLRKASPRGSGSAKNQTVINVVKIDQGRPSGGQAGGN